SCSSETVQCPLLAQSGHANHSQQCPLLGVKRTLVGGAAMSAFDPYQIREFAVTVDTRNLSKRATQYSSASRQICNCLRDEFFYVGKWTQGQPMPYSGLELATSR